MDGIIPGVSFPDPLSTAGPRRFFARYPVTFTAEEQRQLRATFRTGVCDYDRRGVGQRRPAGTWRSYR